MNSVSNVTPEQGADYFKEDNYYSKSEAFDPSKWLSKQDAVKLGAIANTNTLINFWLHLMTKTLEPLPQVYI